MAESDVGGIGVRFTADASQLQQELQSLERRLREFESAHGQTKLKLQASLAMPGNRVLADFRRDIEKAFQSQGAAGQIRARVTLLPPTQADIKAMSAKIGDVKVKVVGSFEWAPGKQPPKSVTVKVIEEVETKGAAGAAGAARRTPAAPRTRRAPAAPAGSTTRAKGEIERSRVSPSEVWGPHFYPDPKELLDMLLEPGGGSKRAIREELIRRGMTWPQLRAIESPAGRTGGPRGFINQFASQTSRALPRIAETGTVPLSSGAIRRMQGSGELPLPFARAGLYDPTIKRQSLTAKTMPSEEEIRSRTRQAMAITPRERMEAGERWWPEAARVIAGMGHGTGLKGPQMAGVAAMATNALDWPGTIRVLDKVFSRMRDGARELEAIFGGTQMTGRDRLKAMDIIKSSGTEAAVEGILRGPKGVQAPKVAEMFRGFVGDPNALPMDRHFQALTTGGEIPTSQIRRVREIVASEIRAAGRQPAGTMAGMWETIGGGEPFGPDPWGQLRARVPGGPRGMAAGVGDDPYAQWRLREQREKMRDANKIRLQSLDAVRAQRQSDYARGAQKRFEALTPEDIERRNAERAEVLFGGRTGGPRGFAAPAWQKGQPTARGFYPVLDKAVSQTGRPGIHVERGTDALGWRTDPRRSLYTVARNEKGVPLGALEMALGGRGHDVQDIMPFVDPGSRGQGIGKSLYAHAQRAGFDVESASDQNAAKAGGQTELGEALWLSRKRQLGVDPQEAINIAAARIGRGPLAGGGPRGFVGAEPRPLAPRGRTGFDASSYRRATPLALSSRGAFAQGVDEPPIEHVDPRSLVPFRELDRETVPRLRARMPQFGPGGTSQSGGFDSGYLSDLTKAIRDGIKEPLRLEYDEAGFAQLTDGNHRLAGALRLVNEGLEGFKVPVQAFAARGMLTGNTARVATPGATTVGGIIGAGGPRGFTGSPFGAPWSRSGSPAGVGGTGDIQTFIEDQAKAAGLIADMHSKLQAQWGGFTTQRGGRRGTQFLEPTPGRSQGPFVSGQGTTIALPRGADPQLLAAGIQALRSLPQHAGLAAAEQRGEVGIGAFANEEKRQIELNFAKVDETLSAAVATQRALGAAGGGAFNVATGREAGGVFAEGNMFGRPATRIPGQPRVRDTATNRVRFASRAQMEQAANTRLPSAEVDLTNLDAPAFQRRAALQQNLARPMASQASEMLANPNLSPEARQFLEEALSGGGGAPPPAAGGGAGPGQDFVGQPRPSPFVQQMLGTIGEGRISIQEARQAGQIRAVGTTVASQLGGLLGRGVDVDKINRMTSVLTKLEHVVRDNADAFEELEGARAEFGEGSEEFRDLDKKLEPAREQMRGLGKEFDALQPNRFAQMATGLASSIGGTIIGLGLFQAATTGLSMVGDAISPVIERMTGYNNIANKTVDALSDQTRALHGFAEEAVAAQASLTGMSDSTAAFVHSLVDQRVAGQAANKNLVEQNDLFQSALAIRRQTGQLPAGVDASALQTTGGLNVFGVQTPLFGTPSAQEILGRQLGGERFADITTFNPNSIAQQAISGNVAGAIGQGGTRLAPATGAGTIPALAAGLFQMFTKPGDIPTAARGEGINTLAGVDPKQIRDFTDSVNMVNSAMDKAADTGLRFAANTDDLSDSQLQAAQAESTRQADLAREAGAPDLAKAIQQAGGRLLFEGLTGSRANQITQIQRAASQYQQGALMPNKGEAAALQGRQIAAQLGLNQQQGQLQRGTMIPGQSFMRQLLAGRAPTGGAVNIPNPLTAGTVGLPPEILRGQMGAPGTPGSFTQNIDTGRLTEGLGQLASMANKGRDALTDMIGKADEINKRAGISSNLLGSFEALTKAAGQTAATIRGISQASAWMQVNLQVKQINEQIFVMNRSLADTQTFLSGVGDSELGRLQYRARGLEIAQAELGFQQQSLSLANQQLGIQSAALSLAQRQRQINFQRALAGFSAPGLTGAERAARQDQAALEADFAQKQQDIGVQQLGNQREAVELARESLGISREQFAIQQAMVTVSAERAIADLARGIGLLQEQARVTVQLQVNSEAIEAYQAVLEEQNAQLTSVIEEAYTVQQTVMSNAAALAAQYGGTLTSWNNMILAHLSDYLMRATDAIRRYGETLSSGSGGGGAAGGGARTNRTASGYYGNVSGATQFTVGEAGPETVAIIRNPRSMTMQPTSSGESVTPIVIDVHDNQIGGEQSDVDEFAAMIARKVEEALGRRISQFGLGTRR